MMKNQKQFIKRRSFLGLISSTLAFGFGYPAFAETDPLRQVVARLSNDAPIRLLGREAAAHTGFDGTLEVILSNLSSRLGLAGFPMANTATVYEGFRHAISADFATAQTVSIDGWVVSQTEVTAYLAAYTYHKDAVTFV